MKKNLNETKNCYLPAEKINNIWTIGIHNSLVHLSQLFTHSQATNHEVIIMN